MVRADKSYLLVEKVPWTFERRVVEVGDALPEGTCILRGLAPGQAHRDRQYHRVPVIERIVAAPLRRRWLAVAVFVLFCVFGYYSFTTLAIEAYPDITDTSAQVITITPVTPPEVEEQITFRSSASSTACLACK